MIKYLNMFFLLLFTCDENKPDDSTSFEMHYISSEFSYDINTSSNFQVKPFAQLQNDTLIVTDYWAMSQQPQLKGEAIIKNDTITLKYLKNPMSTEKDWAPTVETTSKFNGQFPKKITLIMEPAPKARQPMGSESSAGFRDASQVFIKIISLDNL